MGTEGVIIIKLYLKCVVISFIKLDLGFVKQYYKIKNKQCFLFIKKENMTWCWGSTERKLKNKEEFWLFPKTVKKSIDYYMYF